MRRPARPREALLLVLLVLLPSLAFAPALLEGRLLGPGDGAVLHFPARVAVWQAWRRLTLPSWNSGIFGGTPLLATYRPGALFPTTLAVSALAPFAAFQTLVVLSASLAGALVFLYVRRLGAHPLGAYLSGLCFCLGPYLVGHLGDTPTLVAAPTLPLLLLAAEAYVRRFSPGRAVGLAVGVALLLLGGSPEVARAGGALLFGRLLVAHTFPTRGQTPRLATSALTLAAGLLLSAPQTLPTLLAAREAGRQVTGFGRSGSVALPGVMGLILRYVSHTPAPAFALAALPLALTETPVRVFGAAMAACLALQWGRGPLAAPGALALLFDLTLAVLAGLSFSAQWTSRRDRLGHRLRIYLLFSSLAAVAALSASAAVLSRPLPEALSGAVGVLALSYILYFALARAPADSLAGLWLLPLTVSFLLQPEARASWEPAPTRRELAQGTPTRQAVEHAMGTRNHERVLTLARSWPGEELMDLAYADLGALRGRRVVEGYEPMVPRRTLLAFEDMSLAGTLSGAFFRSDPLRLAIFGVRWVQVPASALLTVPDAAGLGDTLDLELAPGRPRSFPVPLVAATELRLASLLADAVAVPQGQPVALARVRLGSGREIDLPLRAGIETAEWAYDRPDVRGQVAHQKAPVLSSWEAGGFAGHIYLAVLKLPGRYYVDGVRLERAPGAPHFRLSRMAFMDGPQARPISLVSSYVSDVGRFREAAATPRVRLYEVSGATSRARVVERLRLVADEAALRAALRMPPAGFDPAREALAIAGDAAGVDPPAAAQASQAAVTRDRPGHIEVAASGPGVLVLAEGWDAGWSARVDDKPAPTLRVNLLQLGVPLSAGSHQVRLRHATRGFVGGLALAALGALTLGLLRQRPES